METFIVPAQLRAKLGHDASEGLVDMFAAYQQFATDRFERRLTQDASALRIEFRDGLTAVRLEVASLRAEMGTMRSELMKWTLLLWLGQFAALTAVLSFVLRR